MEVRPRKIRKKEGRSNDDDSCISIDDPHPGDVNELQPLTQPSPEGYPETGTFQGKNAYRICPLLNLEELASIGVNSYAAW